MSHVGYTLSSEEHGPNDLVENAATAEDVGFDFLSISDHFHPWVPAQGESPFVWGTLGGVAAATEDIEVGVGVTCPTMRIHPAIVAQASATAASMMDGRFTFGVGTGERLNEHVLGDHWPDHETRLAMLREAVSVIRSLWEGGMTSHHGDHYTVENAQLFTRPEETPPIIASAFGEETATEVASYADGFWTVGPQGDLLDAYEEAGGGGPTYTQLSVCYAETEDEAVETVYEQWPNGALPGGLSGELPTPAHFKAACESVSEEDIREGSTVTDPDPSAHAESIEQAFEEGFDHVYIHQIGPDQASFFEFYEDEILPTL